MLDFGNLSWFWRFKENSCPVLIWGFGGNSRLLNFNLASWFWFWYSHWSLIHSSSLSWFWRCKEHPCPFFPHLFVWRMLEDPDWRLASRSLFGYGNCSLIHPYSEFWLYLDFEDAKNIYVIQVLIWSFDWGWRVLIGVWHLYIEFDIVAIPWYINI